MRTTQAILPVLLVSVTVTSGLGAQIRTPIATEPLSTSQPGPAPYNAKAAATSPTSAAVSWDAIAGVRGYTVVRTRTDNPSCCVAQSGLLTTPSWNDGTLEAGQEYSFAITALYTDGRAGATEVVTATPLPVLPTVRLPRGAELSSAEGVLRLTPCGQRSTGGPEPATITPQTGSPAGARFFWSVVPGTGMNYVVDRAPEGTTTWTLVGSTCGGPSPIDVQGTQAYVRDLAGGVTGGRYVYRVTAVSSTGAVGWKTYNFRVPCYSAPIPKVSVSGSTVTVSWGSGSRCGFDSSVGPDTYTLSTSFGFTKTKNAYGWSTETLYGVPVGSHSISLVGNYRTGGTTTKTGVTAVVAY